MQGEEGALSLTTKEQSPDAVVKGRPLNYCAGFRPQKIANEQCRNPDGKPFPYDLELHLFPLGFYFPSSDCHCSSLNWHPTYLGHVSWVRSDYVFCNLQAYYEKPLL
jgi:hypothetical protein